MTIAIGSADRGLKIKWHSVTTWRHRERSKETDPETAFQVSRRGSRAPWTISRWVYHAVIGPIAVAWYQKPSNLAIERHLVRQVNSESLKAEARIRRRNIGSVRDVIIEMKEIITK